ncbi:MAG TPA: hypothetical protein VLG12_07875 [Candidatus Saccharimonadales bacterium]|nr:hypothetical protein [Candidatus Saccharimonadales bacterium]
MPLSIFFAILSILSGLIVSTQTPLPIPKTILIDGFRQISATSSAYTDSSSGQVLFAIHITSKFLGEIEWNGGENSVPVGTKTWVSSDNAVKLNFDSKGVVKGTFDPVKAGEPSGNPITLSPGTEGLLVGYGMNLLVTEGREVIKPLAELRTWQPSSIKYVSGNGDYKDLMYGGTPYTIAITTEAYESYAYIFTLRPGL